MKLIQFGAECGSTKAGSAIAKFQNKLNKIFFDKESDSNFFKSYEFLSIVLRVSGKHKNFNGEGPEFLKKSRGRNVLTIDLTIPQAVWESKSSREFGEYIRNGVVECFGLLKQKALNNKEVLSQDVLEMSFNNGLDQFNEFIGSL